MKNFTEKTMPNPIGASEDALLDIVFDDAEGWQEAIQRGVDKDISRKELEDICTPASVL